MTFIEAGLIVNVCALGFIAGFNAIKTILK